MKYGLPYQGSKSSIAEFVIQHIPPSDVFVDLFAGGCAVTHCALLSGKFKKVIANDITSVPSAFAESVENGVKCLDFVSRDDFAKTDNQLLKIIYSFGNNCKDYLYSEEKEIVAKAIHESVFFDNHKPISEITCVDIEIRNNSFDWFTFYTKLKKIVSSTIGGDGRAVHIERINRIQALKSPILRSKLDRLQIVQGDYRNLEIPQNSVVYCDIPYVGKAKYKNDFDHEEFYEWCMQQKQPLYISEYYMPEDFTEIAAVKKLNQMCAKSNFKNIEKLFTYNSQVYNDQTSLF